MGVFIRFRVVFGEGFPEMMILYNGYPPRPDGA